MSQLKKDIQFHVEVTLRFFSHIQGKIFERRKKMYWNLY